MWRAATTSVPRSEYALTSEDLRLIRWSEYAWSHEKVFFLWPLYLTFSNRKHEKDLLFFCICEFIEILQIARIFFIQLYMDCRSQYQTQSACQSCWYIWFEISGIAECHLLVMRVLGTTLLWWPGLSTWGQHHTIDTRLSVLEFLLACLLVNNLLLSDNGYLSGSSDACLVPIWQFSCI